MDCIYSEIEHMKKLFVGNLSHQTTDAGLAAFFEKYGPLQSCTVVKDRLTEQSRGFAFVELEKNDMAAEAISALDGQSLDGRQVRVSEAKPREENRGGSWGNNGRSDRGFDNRRSGARSGGAFGSRY